MFTAPVRMTEGCGHNFCHACLLNFTAGQEYWFCPECRSEQTKQPDNLMRNRLAEKGILSYNAEKQRDKSRNLCSHHNLELTLCKSNLKVRPGFISSK